MTDPIVRDITDEVNLLGLHAQQPARYPVVLESLGAAAGDDACDIVLALPGARLESRNGRLRAQGWQPPVGTDFFTALSAWAAAESVAAVPGLPFVGGWFVFLGYEAARLVEPRLELPAAAGLPDALALRCTGVIVRQRASGRCRIVAESAAGAARIAADLHALAADADGAPVACGAVNEDDPEAFLSGVSRVLDYLHAGDVYQVNLSRRWWAALPAAGDYVQLYRQLRAHNPAPFAGLARLGEVAVLSSSPERLLQVVDRRVTTQPIAGTRPRDADAARDASLRDGLRVDLKERAEHLMLIDLERNDLGRVCRAGSVEVSELMAVHSHAHVHHIVSTVAGQLRPGLGAVDALRAVFPGGTITGCPKLRSMQIIAQLERVGRGAYTGSMGYLSRCGRLDMNILIRTLVCGNGHVSFRAGAGIVADSSPEHELAETRAKARGLLLAIGAVV